MNTYALIENGAVINVIVWDGGPEWVSPTSVTAVELPANSSAGIGWSYANGTFTAPVAAT